VRWRLRIAGLVIALASALPAAAQVPPTAGEVAAQGGLHAAAWRGDVKAIERLVMASPTALASRDGHGRTPLQVAVFARQHDAIRALLAAGADTGALEHDRYDAVTIAAVADDEDSLRLLLAAGASARLVTSRYDGTALIAAAHLGHDGIVRQLIAAGAPLDHVNNLHWTALIEAIVLGDGGPRHQATVRALLDAGANAHLTDRQGRTPLQLARERGYVAMVQMLERATPRQRTGACPTARCRSSHFWFGNPIATGRITAPAAPCRATGAPGRTRSIPCRQPSR
jgi:ankyrin repeat protein